MELGGPSSRCLKPKNIYIWQTNELMSVILKIVHYQEWFPLRHERRSYPWMVNVWNTLSNQMQLLASISTWWSSLVQLPLRYPQATPWGALLYAWGMWEKAVLQIRYLSVNVMSITGIPEAHVAIVTSRKDFGPFPANSWSNIPAHLHPKCSDEGWWLGSRH